VGLVTKGGSVKQQVQRIVAGLIVSVAAFTGAVTIAAPATAATVNRCNGELTNRGYIPVYIESLGPGLGSSATKTCYQNTGAYTYAATRAIQKSYNLCYANQYGWPLLDPDGAFGPLTAQAIKNVQRVHGLSQDGSYGPLTSQKFKTYLSNGTCGVWVS
jgi:murein L,D-transpeptidase YcbB/YkuD